MFFFNLDLLPSDSFTPTLHLVAYSVNQKGRSEPTVLEDIAINEAEKRTGEWVFAKDTRNPFHITHKLFVVTSSCAGEKTKLPHITSYINSCLQCTAWEQFYPFCCCFLPPSRLKDFTRSTSTLGYIYMNYRVAQTFPWFQLRYSSWDNKPRYGFLQEKFRQRRHSKKFENGTFSVSTLFRLETNRERSRNTFWTLRTRKNICSIMSETWSDWKENPQPKNEWASLVHTLAMLAPSGVEKM